MSVSIADIFEDYVESKSCCGKRERVCALYIPSHTLFLCRPSNCLYYHTLGLQNLPSEIDQNMRELRGMDEEFQRTAAHSSCCGSPFFDISFFFWCRYPRNIYKTSTVVRQSAAFGSIAADASADSFAAASGERIQKGNTETGPKDRTCYANVRSRVTAD